MKKWNAEFTIQIGSWPKIEYFGREPFTVEDPKYLAALIDIGTFKKIDEKTLAYSGNAGLVCDDGCGLIVDKDGNIDESKACEKCSEIVAAEFIGLNEKCGIRAK